MTSFHTSYRFDPLKRLSLSFHGIWYTAKVNFHRYGGHLIITWCIVIVICKYDSDVNADKTIVTAVMKVILLYLLTKSVIKTKGSFRAGLLYTI